MTNVRNNNCKSLTYFGKPIAKIAIFIRKQKMDIALNLTIPQQRTFKMQKLKLTKLKNWEYTNYRVDIVARYILDKRRYRSY